MKRAALLAGMTVIALTAGSDAEMLRQEPPMGGLKEGQRVLVDDGTCPNGQLLVGGRNAFNGNQDVLPVSEAIALRFQSPWRRGQNVIGAFSYQPH